MAGPIVTKLPLGNVQDHTQVMDEFGNIYEFDAGERTWIFKGVVQEAPIVNTKTAGLITPKILEKLKLLEKLRSQGISFKLFKLASEANTPYFYFFYSSDDLIRFYPEGPSRLRLEVDRAKLLSKFLSQCCVGPKGQKGLTGDAGKDGTPAPNEVFQDPVSTDDGEFVISAKVPTPIDQPISLRIFSGTATLAEILIPLEAIYGEMVYGKIPYAYTSEISVTIIDPSVDIDAAKIQVSYDVSTQVLDATIPFTTGIEQISTWQFKARQRGPKGDAGSDGRDFFEIVEQFFDDPLLRSDQAIVSLRKPSTSTNLLFIKKPVFEEVCSTNLVPVGGLYPKNKPETVSFVAVRTTPRPCKDIGSFKFVAPEYKVPVLEFPSWTPSPDCCDSSMYNVRRFNWYDRTDPAYIFKIAEDPRPPEQCCQEEFFWCPNVGDNSCGVQGSLTPPHRSKPPNAKAKCKCDSPPEVKLKLQGGGYVFKPLECDNSGQTSPPVSSNVGGTVDQYSIKCKVKGKWKFSWFVDWDDKLCDPKAGTPKPQCDVNSNGIGQGNQISKDNFPAQYTFEGDTGDDCNIENKEFFLTVNTNKQDCCRAYKVQASVECTCEPKKPSSSSSSSSESSNSDSSDVTPPVPQSSNSEESQSESESTDGFVAQIQSEEPSSASSESDSSEESGSSASSQSNESSSESSQSNSSASSASSSSSQSNESNSSASSASTATSGTSASSSSSQSNESNSSASSASTATSASSASSPSSASSASSSSESDVSSPSSPSSASSLSSLSGVGSSQSSSSVLG